MYGGTTEARFFTQIYPRWWGRKKAGVRPVLIVQNEIGNRHSPTVIAAAITSRLDKHRLPTHINIRAADTGLAKDSVVLLEQIRTLDKHRLRERAGQITPEDQKRVDQALDELRAGQFWLTAPPNAKRIPLLFRQGSLLFCAFILCRTF